MITELQNHLAVGESTAGAIARYFKKRGVLRNDISGDDMEPFYREMNQTSDAAIHLDGISITYPALENINCAPTWGVIVETRAHPSLEFVVNQFSNNLNIGIQIFHGSQNKQFIKKTTIRRLIDNGRVQLTNLGIGELTRRQYNALLLTQDFWRAVHGRKKILVFQTDALLCSKSAYRLDDFREFDYIGSKWKRNRPVGIVIDGGNGGLSLRDWNLTLKCLQRFPANLWPGGEDAYFAFHFDLVGGNVAREQDSARFSTQIDFIYESFGGHKIQNLDKLSLQQFLYYCPEAQLTLD